MSEVRLLAPEIREQLFALLQDAAVPVQPFSVHYREFFITADQLLPLPRANAATYHLCRGAAEAGQWAGQPPIRVLLRRVGDKLEQAFQYPHGWRDMVYDLPGAWQTDTEVLLGFRMVSDSAGRNRWFGRRDSKIETRTPAQMQQLADALRQELARTFAAQNSAPAAGLPTHWLTVARLPLAAPTRLQADAATKTLLLRQLSQALVVGEVLRRESFGEDDEDDAPAPPAHYLLGAMHHGRTDQTSRFVAEGRWENDDPSRYGDVLQQVRPGDRVAIKASFAKGLVSMLRVKARGTVQATEAGGQVLRIAWDAPFPHFDLPGLGGYQRTAHQLTRPEDIAAIFQPATPAPIMPAHPLNQILYGPPGTGKTYGTTPWALALLNPNNLSVVDIEGHYGDNHAAMRQAYEQHRQLGQVGFVSFHQSFGYEDFVEGIKPVLADAEDADEDAGNIRYRIEAGIFKTLAERAIYGLHLARQARMRESHASGVVALEFEVLYSRFLDYLFERLGDDGAGLVMSSKSSKVVLFEITAQGALRFQFLQGTSKQKFAVTKSRLEKLYNTFPDVASIANVRNDIEKTVGQVASPMYWTAFKELKEFEARELADQSAAPEVELDVDTHLRQALDRPELAASVARDFDFSQLTPEDYAAAPRFVLIIDEINRGNVASIFGELITLLEDDKRGGQPHELRLTLPYSKQSFVVPPNLYVLGTMNTADRSVEALDAALRRRFSFHELAPNPEKLPSDVAGVNLQALLRALNERLELLLDRDHRLGHAWLMQVRDLPGLRAVFGEKIIPQLQEYFYGHWGRIGQVLGEGFVRLKPATVRLMAGFADEDGLEEPAPRYAITPADSWTADTFRQLCQ